MTRSNCRLLAITVLVLLVWGSGTAEAARYRYGRYAAAEQAGFFVYVEGLLANPRNTDTVLVTHDGTQDFPGGVNFVTTVTPAWDDEFSGRLGFGYQWAAGSRIEVNAWGFQTQQRNTGDGPLGGSLHFAVGPPIFTGGDYVGDVGTPGHYDIDAEITATTADVLWGHKQELGEAFTLDWTVGLRWARYEETLTGFYDEVDSTSLGFGVDRWAADKSLEGDMIGARVGLRANYRFANSLSASGGLGFTLLDGEINGSSRLIPTGTSNSFTQPSSLATVNDDSRSGNQIEIDVRVNWHFAGDRFRVWAGWEQSIWNEIAVDVLRNFPGTSVSLAERDSVTFSAYKFGVFFSF